MNIEPGDNLNDADELVGTWLDSEPAAAGSVIPARHGKSQVRRAADLQLVHSLLVHMAQRDESAAQARVQAVLHGIDAMGRPTARLARLTRSFAPYALAAMLALACIAFFMQMQTNTAAAAVDRMIAAFDRAGDRTYQLTLRDAGKGGRPEPAGPGERAQLDGATLYLRGSDKFVLSRLTPSGKTVINGSDGRTRWLIRPDKPVLISTDPQAFRIPMPPDLAQILSLDLKETLVHIRDNYRVAYVDSAGQNAPTHIEATKTAKGIPGPKNIRISADAGGLLTEVEFIGIHLQGDQTPRNLTIRLSDQKQLSDDWFTHQAHHPADAEVDSVTGE